MSLFSIAVIAIDPTTLWGSNAATTGSVNSSLSNESPHWEEFWTPTRIDNAADPMVTLCKLNFRKYSESPHQYPMFRDLETMSSCSILRSRRASLSSLLAEIHTDATRGLSSGRTLAPTAFFFHESRVGSTLVANTLACDPFSLVFSESPPPASALLHGKGDRARRVKLFRDIVTVMGRSPFHTRLFFKFQSITSTMMTLALEVLVGVIMYE